MRMKFSGKYASSSDVPKFDKKRSSTKIEGSLFPESSEDKKKSSSQFGTIFGWNLGFIGADSHFFV